MVGNGVDFSSEVEAFVTCQHYFACKVSDKMGCEPLSQGRYKKIIVLNLIIKVEVPPFL